MLCLPQAMRYPPKAFQKYFESVEVCLCAYLCVCVCVCVCVCQLEGRESIQGQHAIAICL